MNLISSLCLLLWTAVAQAKKFPGQDLDLEEYRKGVEAAAADLSKKAIRYPIVRQPRLIDDQLKEVAKAEHGIDIILHGCVRPERGDYHEGYQNTVIAFLKKRHGHDPVATLEQELLRKWLAEELKP